MIPRPPAGDVLGTPRLLLRRFRLDDLADHARLYAQPEVTRFLGGGPFEGEQAARRSRAAVEMFVEHWARHGFGVWAVLDRVGGGLIGQCGLKYLPESPDVELLYAIDPAYWGRGLVTEAAAAALADGFDRTDLPRIVAVTRPEHGASRRVMDKLGMRYEGEVTVYGLRAVLYAISRAEFTSRATTGSSAGGNA